MILSLFFARPSFSATSRRDSLQKWAPTVQICTVCTSSHNLASCHQMVVLMRACAGTKVRVWGQVPTPEVQDSLLTIGHNFCSQGSKKCQNFSVSYLISLILDFLKEKILNFVWEVDHQCLQAGVICKPTTTWNLSYLWKERKWECTCTCAVTRYSHTHRPKVQCTMTHTFRSFVFNRMFFVTLALLKVYQAKGYFIKNIDVLVPYINCYKLKT